MPPAAVAPSTTIHGSRCESEQAPNGTWTVRNVPLFGEMTYTSPKGKTIPVDKAWLENAVAKAQDGYRRAEYLPTLHINHHDFGDPVSPAGKFLPTRVGRAKTREGEVWAVFGDLVGVFPEVYEQIRQGRLPYLSCEAHMERGLLESCALLPTRPPVHKFPPLTIGSERKTEKFVTRDPALVAFSATGVGARVLCRIPHMNSPACAPTKDPLKAVATVKAADKPDDDETKDTSAPAAEDTGAPPEAPPADAMPPPPAADPMAPPPVDPLAPPVPPPGGGIDPVVTLLTNLGTKMDAMMAVMTKLTEAPLDDNPGEPAPIKGTPSTAFADPAVKALEKAHLALAARIEGKEKIDQANAEIAAVERELTPFAHAIPNLRHELEVLHTTGGKASLVAFAQTVRRTIRRDPTTSTLDYEEGAAVVLPDELSKFANRGPDELAVVAGLSREYDSRGPTFARTMTRERFVDVHLRLKAMGR